MHIFYLHNIKKLIERSQTIPLDSKDILVCWFKNCEDIVLAYETKFQILNVLTPQKAVLNIEYELVGDGFIGYSSLPPP